MIAEGLYLYCIAKENGGGQLEARGIDGAPIKTIAHRGLVAIVQGCEPKPFASKDQKVLADWLLIHQNVVDLAWDHYETVIPFGFDSIIVPTRDKSTLQNLCEWLGKETSELNDRLEYLKNKAEYGIQIVWDPTVIALDIRECDHEIKQLEDEIRSKPAGVAYLLQEKLRVLIQQRLEEVADTRFKAFYQQISKCVENIQVEKIRKENLPKQMILNVSCLQKKDEIAVLGKVLDNIGRMPGFDVRFTGPWAPYSFANESSIGSKDFRSTIFQPYNLESTPLLQTQR